MIPAYNEQARLPSSLEKIWNHLPDAEIIVVDDGSTDNTRAVVERFAADHPGVRLVNNPGNRGKGYAVRHGMLEAAGEWILFTDADLSAPIEEVARLMSAARERNAEVVIGSRALDRSLIGVTKIRLRATRS